MTEICIHKPVNEFLMDDLITIRIVIMLIRNSLFSCHFHILLTSRIKKLSGLNETSMCNERVFLGKACAMKVLPNLQSILFRDKDR